ncbi:MAG: sigma-70 family RNA polymerase sigma factor [Actinobacteria bacterium]|nr:sigma-70 family RNA polymerase sigma factor [Actinomycetota bacterium]
MARRHSVSAADAEDAFQRALEKLLTRAPHADEDRLRAWLLTVVRNEALTIVRTYKRSSHEPFDEALAGQVAPDADLADGAVAVERLAHGSEALKRITADQMRCLLLRADGLNYYEICDRTGFSYPKVNRCLTEGRKAFRGHVSMIADGGECRRLEPALSQIADGVATAELVEDAQIHLRNCLACRQTLVEFRLAPSDVAALFPVGLSLSHGGSALARVGELAQNMISAFHERFVQFAPMQQGAEAVFAKKAVATAAVAAALAGGGVAVERAGLLPGGGVDSGDTSLNQLPGSSGAVSGGSEEAQVAVEPDADVRTARHAKPRAVQQSDIVDGTRNRDAADSAAPNDLADRSGASAGDPDQVVAPPPDVDGVDAPEMAPGDGYDGGQAP